MITRRAGHRYEICARPAARDDRRWLEAHERWVYDERTGVQSLRRLICLCSDTVTGMTDDQADDHIAAAARRWAEQSGRTWALDLGVLTEAGVRLAPPDEPVMRAEAARRYS